MSSTHTLSLLRPLIRAPLRKFSSSPAACAPKGNQGGQRFDGQGQSGSHMSNNDPEILEKEKQKNLKNGSSWNETLASTSEAAVKADREEVKGGDISDNLEQLQRASTEHLAGKDKAGQPSSSNQNRGAGQRRL
ncbi:hypothetical protein HK097_005382 [Rhizophlyctis rosea]|uniref:Uncharacterized protein n=1 Tax=Rhizophlyctis rosea TaxID=64517 RepID=A0AAD5SEC3_9FUNG|nr:hypothetical protein HK097_005382 [Rhizophlyctis rosea]